MTTTKTHWKKAFNLEYIGSADLEDYKDIILTVKEVRLEQTKGTKEKELKNIAYFVENVKPMILNATNCKTLRKLAGGSNYINDWQNITIQLYVETGVKAFGDVIDALRIRPFAPKVQAQNTQVDVTVAILNLTRCETQEQLRTVYSQLSKDEQKHPSVQEIKEKLKSELPQ